MKELRLVILVAYLGFMLVALQHHLYWGMYVGIVVLFLVFKWMDTQLEKKSKGQVQFKVNDSEGSLRTSLVVYGLITFDLLFIKKNDPVSFIVYLTLMLYLDLFNPLDEHFIFDESGIKTRRKSLAYDQIQLAVMDKHARKIDEGTPDEMIIQRHLLSEALVHFLNNRMKIQDKDSVMAKL